MFKENKIDKFINDNCPNCGKLIKSGCVTCPHCDSNLKFKKTEKNENHSRFICPGCGEKSSAKNHGLYCERCDAFIHRRCQLKGEFVEAFSTFWALCPICNNKHATRMFDVDPKSNLFY